MTDESLRPPYVALEARHHTLRRKARQRPAGDAAGRTALVADGRSTDAPAMASKVLELAPL